MAKGKRAETFMEFWNSPTTKNVLTIWAPMLGFLVTVPIAKTIGRHHDMPMFSENYATLYSATVVTSMISEVAKGLGIDVTELAKILAAKGAS